MIAMEPLLKQIVIMDDDTEERPGHPVRLPYLPAL